MEMLKGFRLWLSLGDGVWIKVRVRFGSRWVEGLFATSGGGMKEVVRWMEFRGEVWAGDLNRRFPFPSNEAMAVCETRGERSRWGERHNRAPSAEARPHTRTAQEKGSQPRRREGKSRHTGEMQGGMVSQSRRAGLDGMPSAASSTRCYWKVRWDESLDVFVGWTHFCGPRRHTEWTREWVGGEAVEALDSQFLKIQAVMGRMEMGQ